MGCSSSDRAVGGRGPSIGLPQADLECAQRVLFAVAIGCFGAPPPAATPSLAGALGENRQAMVGARF